MTLVMRVRSAVLVSKLCIENSASNNKAGRRARTIPVFGEISLEMRAYEAR